MFLVLKLKHFKTSGLFIAKTRWAMLRSSSAETSTGMGISHSEKAHGSKQVHCLQIWALPSTSRLPPKYYMRHFSDADKTDKWARIVTPVGADGVLAKRECEGPAPVQNGTLYGTLLGQGKTLQRPLAGKKGYIHVVQTSGYDSERASGASLRVRGKGGEELTLREGDGAYIHFKPADAVLEVENNGDRVFDLN